MRRYDLVKDQFDKVYTPQKEAIDEDCDAKINKIKSDREKLLENHYKDLEQSDLIKADMEYQNAMKKLSSEFSNLDKNHAKLLNQFKLMNNGVSVSILKNDRQEYGKMLSGFIQHFSKRERMRAIWEGNPGKATTIEAMISHAPDLEKYSSPSLFGTIFGTTNNTKVDQEMTIEQVVAPLIHYIKNLEFRYQGENKVSIFIKATGDDSKTGHTIVATCDDDGDINIDEYVSFGPPDLDKTSHIFDITDNTQITGVNYKPEDDKVYVYSETDGKIKGEINPLHKSPFRINLFFPNRRILSKEIKKYRTDLPAYALLAHHHVIPMMNKDPKKHQCCSIVEKLLDTAGIYEVFYLNRESFAKTWIRTASEDVFDNLRSPAVAMTVIGTDSFIDNVLPSFMQNKAKTYLAVGYLAGTAAAAGIKTLAHKGKAILSPSYIHQLALLAEQCQLEEFSDLEEAINQCKKTHFDLLLRPYENKKRGISRKYRKQMDLQIKAELSNEIAAINKIRDEKIQNLENDFLNYVSNHPTLLQKQKEDFKTKVGPSYRDQLSARQREFLDLFPSILFVTEIKELVASQERDMLYKEKVMSYK